MSGPRSILRAAGSLWFAAVLLLLLLVGMACATVFEVGRGADQTLALFYRSWWFEGLLALVFVNVVAATLVRYPFSKRLIGFVVTHISILVILLGALISARFGIEGVVGLADGETADYMSDRQRPTLTIVAEQSQAEAAVDLDPALFQGFRALDKPAAARLGLGPVTVAVERFLPDSEWLRQVVEDDSSHSGPAVEVAVTLADQDDVGWVFPNHSGNFGGLDVSLRLVADPAELARLLAESASDVTSSLGTLKVVCGGADFEIPLEECSAVAVAVGGTGYSVRVLRYLPHAIVGPDKLLVNKSDSPVNPAVEVELTGPSATEKRFCFARFPGFGHGPHTIADVDISFVSMAETTSATPVEVLCGAGGELHVRFSREGMPTTALEVSLGSPIKIPWLDGQFAVRRYVAHARTEWGLEAVEPAREERSPAVLVTVVAGEERSETWLQKHRPRKVTAGGATYELTFADKQVPLGFEVTLNSFRIGTYPGGSRPRSFESMITLVDPDTGRRQDRVISMNRPTAHGGYTIYQSSYSDRGEQVFSFLSVSRDPGRIVVFTGYISLMLGMTLVLVTRLATPALRVQGPVGPASVPVNVAPRRAELPPAAPGDT